MAAPLDPSGRRAEEGKPQHGVVVVIVLPDNGPSSSSSFVGEEAIALTRTSATFSLRRAAAVVLALAVAGYFFLYADAGAAWRFSVAPEAGQGASSSSSFLLPLHAKAKNSTDAALKARGNAFQDRCVRAAGARIRFRLLCPTVKRFALED
jgi:hypothetical protein